VRQQADAKGLDYKALRSKIETMPVIEQVKMGIILFVRAYNEPTMVYGR